MALPKNFNETVNFKNRVESLNNLEFFTVNFNVTLTEEYYKKLRESEITGESVNSELEIISNQDKLTKGSRKKYSALNIDEAKRKFNEWMESLKEDEIISEYEVLDIDSNTFYEELEEKGLMNLLETEKKEDK
jgi:hypothetical protein